jgi:hypothetical protein
MKRSVVLVCTVFGKRYRRMYEAVRSQMEAYATKCKSDLELIQEPLDRDNTHNYLTQRLLIPSRFSRYEIVAHVDIDVLISRGLPSIFESLPPRAGFSATVDPRATRAYDEAWGHAGFTKLTHRQYFEEKGWQADDSLVSINGGVLVFRPPMVAELFETWYRDSSHFKGHPDSYFQCEEGILAYISQKHRLFSPLPVQFNRQVHYALHETSAGLSALARYRSFAHRGTRKLLRSVGAPSNHIGFGREYRIFVEELLGQGNLVHFAGNYPVPRVDAGLLIGSRQS